MLLRWLIHNLVVPAVKDQVIESVSEQTASSRTAEVDEPPELPPCEVAILFGSRVEAEGTLATLKGQRSGRLQGRKAQAGLLGKRSVVVLACGEGGQAAVEATRAVLDRIAPPWVIAAGFAAGLDDSLRRGDIVMPDRLVDEREREFEVGFHIAPEVVAATRGLGVGRLVSLDRLVRTPEQRKQLAAQYNAIACDVETTPIASVCRDRKTRFLAVRVITDTLDDQLPPDVEFLVGQNTLAGKLGAATGTLFRRPGAAQELWKMRDAANRSSARLAKFLAGVVPQLT